MKSVDYDDRLHVGYVQGSRLRPEVLSAWLAAFRRRLPEQRPLRIADVGSGAGRFTSCLADAFGGPVLGIEPSQRMLALALQAPMHLRVEYIGGVCEAIPLADGAMDATLLFGVWHHLRDRVAGAAELARVVRPGGTLLVRTSPSDRLSRPWWDDCFPEVYEIDRSLLPTLAQTLGTITAARFELVAMDDVVLPGVARRKDFAQLQHRSLSTFEHLDDRVVDEGIQRIAAALAIDPDSDRPAPTAPQMLLSFRRR